MTVQNELQNLDLDPEERAQAIEQHKAAETAHLRASRQKLCLGEPRRRLRRASRTQRRAQLPCNWLAIIATFSAPEAQAPTAPPPRRLRRL